MSERDPVVKALGVSRETVDRLDHLVASLTRWQAVKNLVGPRTLDEVWSRHILDSAQLLEHAEGRVRIADLGSGAGFPGLVLAILLRDAPASRVMLVESNGRKCAFLREMVRTLDLPAVVVNQRIETAIPTLAGRVDLVTARALASLNQLLGMTNELLKGPVLGIFPKGQDVADELTEAAKYWTFTSATAVSRTDSKARIVLVREVHRRPSPAS